MNPQDPATWPYAIGFWGPMIPPRVRPGGGLFYCQSFEPDEVRRQAFEQLGPNLDGPGGPPDLREWIARRKAGQQTDSNSTR